MNSPTGYQDLLDFWFSEAMRKRWFASTPELDRTIRERFEPMWQQACAGELDHWLDTPDGALALVIVLDQLPLNMYRGEALAYASEGQAVAAAQRALELGHDKAMPQDRLAFLFLPFMHSEALADQDRSVELFRAAGLTGILYWAEHHREIVRRYGRFPHRNEALGRDSTADELDYLASDQAFKG
ncbi:MAG: DUF924 domain-containing protein [Gallionellaceae bacterium]|nr:DUF924 domain-containing protein [Gallionellaceae bacterium]